MHITEPYIVEIEHAPVRRAREASGKVGYELIVDMATVNKE